MNLSAGSGVIILFKIQQQDKRHSHHRIIYAYICKCRGISSGSLRGHVNAYIF